MGTVTPPGQTAIELAARYPYTAAEVQWLLDLMRGDAVRVRAILEAASRSGLNPASLAISGLGVSRAVVRGHGRVPTI